MRLKLFRGADMAAAMALVRRNLGPEALILSTRRVGDGVEVTAALDEEPVGLTPISTGATMFDAGRDAALAWHGVPASLIDTLPAGPLADALPAALTFETLPITGPIPLLLAGPPGAGKTLTIAKLATRLVMAGHAPLVITADGDRAGAAEQLAAYTRLLGLPLVVADAPVQLGRALNRRVAQAPVLIDSPGLDPFDPAARNKLRALADASGARIVVVLPAGLDPAEAQELAAAFGEVGARLLVATRLDLSRRLGGVLAAASTGLALTEAGIGPAAANGLCPIDPAFIADRLTIPSGARPPGSLQDAA